MPETATALPRFPAPAGGCLTEAMLAAYADAGVLILENFVPRAACDALKARARALVDEFDPAALTSVFTTTDEAQLDDTYFIESGDKIRVFLEAEALDDGALTRPFHESLNKMGHAMHDLDPVFGQFSRTPELAGVASSLGYDDPVILQSMYIFKPPRIGGEVTCHQDSTFLYTEPETCTGFWFALDDATLENGCMHFIPSAHRGPLKRRNYRVSPTELRTDTLDDSGWAASPLPAEAAAGSLVIFDGRTPHMSDANRSDLQRHAYTLHAIERRSHYPRENWLQRDPALPLAGFQPVAAG